MSDESLINKLKPKSMSKIYALGCKSGKKVVSSLTLSGFSLSEFLAALKIIISGIAIAKK